MCLAGTAMPCPDGFSCVEGFPSKSPCPTVSTRPVDLRKQFFLVKYCKLRIFSQYFSWYLAIDSNGYSSTPSHREHTAQPTPRVHCRHPPARLTLTAFSTYHPLAFTVLVAPCPLRSVPRASTVHWAPQIRPLALPLPTALQAARHPKFALRTISAGDGRRPPCSARRTTCLPSVLQVRAFALLPVFT